MPQPDIARLEPLIPELSTALSDTTLLDLDIQTVQIDPQGDLKLIVGAEHTQIEQQTCFVVCSRTLSRVSTVFQRMLYGPFLEASHKEENWTVYIDEDIPSAFEVFVRIAHGHLDWVPRAMTNGQLYQLTKLTHYYDATRILTPWAECWVSSLRRPSSELELFSLLWIYWELERKELLQDTARQILMGSTASAFASDSLVHTIQTPPDILRRIDAIRIQTIHALLDVFRDIIEHLVCVDERTRICQHASFMGHHRCESMILGSLSFCLMRANLWPIPRTVDVKESIASLHKILMNLVIHDLGQPQKKGENHTMCNPKEYLLGRVEAIIATMPDVIPKSDQKQPI